MIRERHDCRACHRVGLVEILNLGDQPPANAYLASVNQPEQRYPLSLRLCESCGMVQLGHIVDPDLLFRDYSFRTSSSTRMVDHFSKLMREVTESMPRNGLLVEIGSNDGTVLSSIERQDIRRLGVDPSGNLWEMARSKIIEQCCDLFTESLAESIVACMGQAHAIIACNVLGHVDDLDDMLAGVESLLHPDGVFVFEVPYLGEFLDRSEFDTIYHEHLSYFSVRPLLILLARHGLRLERVDRQEVHGGSIRCRVTKGTGEGEHIERWRTCHEHWRHFTDVESYDVLAASVVFACQRLKKSLADLRDSGKRVIGYGAAAKSTVRLNVCGIGPDLLPAIVDATPEKIGRFVPGTHQRIVSPESVDLTDYDVVLILPANHEAEITAKIRSTGFTGQIVLPSTIVSTRRSRV